MHVIYLTSPYTLSWSLHRASCRLSASHFRSKLRKNGFCRSRLTHVCPARFLSHTYKVKASCIYTTAWYWRRYLVMVFMHKLSLYLWFIIWVVYFIDKLVCESKKWLIRQVIHDVNLGCLKTNATTSFNNKMTWVWTFNLQHYCQQGDWVT